MDGGIITLDLHLCATCRVRSAAHLIAFILGLHIIVYTGSLILTRYYIICFLSKPIEVKVGLLFEYVLIGCTVTESKYSQIT